MFDEEVSIIEVEMGVDTIPTNGDKVLAKVGWASWLSCWTCGVEQVFEAWHSFGTYLITWHSKGGSEESFGT